MQRNDDPSVKRQQDGEHELSVSNLKKIKLEDEENGERNASSPTNPPTQGVEQILYPLECRPTSNYYTWHRHHLIADVKKRLASQYKRVLHVRFLDDAVALDWIFDKEAIRQFDVSRTEFDSKTSDALFYPLKSEQIMDTNVEEIPGLIFLRSNATSNVTRCTVDDPLEPGTKIKTNQTNKTTRCQDRTPPGDTRRVVPVSLLDALSNSSDFKSESSLVSELQGGMEEGQVTAARSGQTLIDVRVKEASSSELVSFDHDARCTSATGDSSIGPSIRRRCPSSASSSSTSSAESSSSPMRETTHLPPRVSGPSYSSDTLAYETFRSLQRLDWRRSQSTLILRDLPFKSNVNDVQLYLQLNQLSCTLIRDVQVHVCASHEHRPIGSVSFESPSEALAAMRVLSTGALPFFASSGEETESTEVQIELYRPPERRESDALHCEAGPLSDSSRPDRQPQFSQVEEYPSRSNRSLRRRRSDYSMSQTSDSRCRSSPSHPVTSTTETISGPRTRIMEGTRQFVPNAERAFTPRGRDPAKQRTSPFPSEFGERSGVETTAGGRSDPGEYSSSDDYSSASTSSDSDSDYSSCGSATNPSESSTPAVLNTAHINRVRHLKQIQLPTVKHGRARRLLRPSLSSSPLVSVSMRGDVQFIDQCSRERLVNLSLPAKVSDVHRLEDACIVNDAVILGFNKGEKSQASVVTFVDEEKSGAKITPLLRAPHAPSGILSLAQFQTLPSRKSPPTSMINAGDVFEFISGGYDKRVHHWRVTCRIEGTGESCFSSRVSSLTKTHLNSKVSALLHLPGGSHVLAGVGQRVWTLDASGHTQNSAIHLSNLINQLHAPSKKNPGIFIAEMDHPYAQVQIHDLRTSRGKPILEFGYPDTGETRHVRSHKRRGDASAKYFARGYEDGTVCVWDYRNVKDPLVNNKCGNPITHTIFAGRESKDLWALGGNKVQFIEVK